MAKGKKTGGRKAGVPNKGTILVRERCRALIDDPHYVEHFKARLYAGQLPPVLEAMTWYYAHNKPTEQHEISGRDGGPIPYKWQD